MNTADDATQAQPVPVGSLVMDLRRRKIGQVMGKEGPCLQLRPPKGGREWDARLDDIRPATDAEKLSAKVQVANWGSRWT
ncbi:hypothetical protein J1792_22695 [Streptomyces triculaminicus]|uniref:Uncharacterized protein n=1 Tax=Streptomyces triculaminicus TaxID=2816232 RepID=A0A939JQE0_9ACTN|nr:hypothetical protein [Streptomyces triculaminicus]